MQLFEPVKILLKPLFFKGLKLNSITRKKKYFVDLFQEIEKKYRYIIHNYPLYHKVRMTGYSGIIRIQFSY